MEKCKVCFREIYLSGSEWRHVDVVSDHWHPAVQEAAQQSVQPTIESIGKMPAVVISSKGKQPVKGG